MKNYNHALLVMEKQDYPADAREVIIRTEEKILNNEKANKLYESMYRSYWLKKKNFDTFKDKVKALGMYAVATIHNPLISTTTRCCPAILTTRPTTPAKSPSTIRTLSPLL